MLFRIDGCAACRTLLIARCILSSHGATLESIIMCHTRLKDAASDKAQQSRTKLREHGVLLAQYDCIPQVINLEDAHYAPDCPVNLFSFGTTSTHSLLKFERAGSMPFLVEFL
ncbi:hypothetical protein WG66_011567 [Moniliophthora roreri]|nr:hypothetical protein WG66_011567 [Moniliophthora roreri]